MARSDMLSALIFSAVAAGMPDIHARQQNAGTACGTRGQALSTCLGSGGATFCSAFLAPKTTALTTTTTTLTSILGTSTSTASPAVTSTVSGNTTSFDTITSTLNVIVTAGTQTFFVATTTANVNSTSTNFTCASPAAGTSNYSVLATESSASASPTAANSTSASSAASSGVSVELPTVATSLVKRQARASVSVTTPACFASFTSRYGVAGAVSTPCRNCFGVAFPSPATVTIPTSTVTTTLYAIVLAVSTPTIEVTVYSTAQATTTATMTATVNATAGVNSTATVTSTSVIVLTTTSPVPTAFNIFYTNVTNNASSQSFARAANVTGGTGTFIVFGGNRDTWNIDGLNRLVPADSPGDFLADNPIDRHPFAFLVDTAPTANTPTCAGCNGTLFCNNPGDNNDEFAICDGVLALGPPSAFVGTDCSNVTLQYQ